MRSLTTIECVLLQCKMQHTTKQPPHRTSSLTTTIECVLLQCTTYVLGQVSFSRCMVAVLLCVECPWVCMRMSYHMYTWMTHKLTCEHRHTHKWKCPVTHPLSQSTCPQGKMCTLHLPPRSTAPVHTCPQRTGNRRTSRDLRARICRDAGKALYCDLACLCSKRTHSVIK